LRQWNIVDFDSAVSKITHVRLFLLLVLLALGCATPQAFVPLAEVRSAAPDGEHGAADYALEPHTHVQVWSRGAFRDDSQGKTETVVHVGFVLDNQGPVPVRLDEKRLFLEDVGSTEGGFEKLVPVEIDGNAPVAPSGKGQVEAYFTLPQRVWPSDIVGYRVVWALDSGEKTSLQHTVFQSTRFGPRVYLAEYPYYPYSPWGWYYPWRPYYAPYPFWGGAVYGPRVYVAPRVYRGPRVYGPRGGPRYLARPRAR
jgi:hypothetical protein